MPSGPRCGGSLNSVMVPSVVILPNRSPRCSVNHNAPPGPDVIQSGRLVAVGTGNSVIVPSLVTLPMLLPRYSVNQKAPSGPRAIPSGQLFMVGTGKLSNRAPASAWGPRHNGRKAMTEAILAESRDHAGGRIAISFLPVRCGVVRLRSTPPAAVRQRLPGRIPPLLLAAMRIERRPRRGGGPHEAVAQGSRARRPHRWDPCG